MSTLKLRWFCEKSRVVFFSAAGRICEVYAFSLDTKTFQKIRGGLYLHGYEMDQVAYHWLNHKA